MVNPVDVAAYYDEYTADYLVASDILELGRFASNDDEHVAIMAQRARVKDGERILDCGCGVGGVVARLGRMFPRCQVDGVTISDVQVNLARQRLADLPHCRVWQEDYQQLSARDESMDLVMFCETLGYAQLEIACAQAFRVLRPGGRVYIQDVCAVWGPLGTEDREALEHFRRSWTYAAHPVPHIQHVFCHQGFTMLHVDESYTEGLASPVGPALMNTRLPQRHPSLRRPPPLTYADFLFLKP